MSTSAVLLPSSLGPDPMFAMTPTCSHCGHDVPASGDAQRRIQDLESQIKILNSKAAAAVDKLADYEDEIRSLKAARAQSQQQQQEQQQETRPPMRDPSTHVQQSIPTPPPEQSANTLSITPPVVTSMPNPSSPPRTASRLASLSSFLPGRKRDTAILTQPPNTPSISSFPQIPSTSNPAYLDATSPVEPTTSRSNHAQLQSQQPITLLSLQTSLENERNLRLRAESSLTQTQSELEELTATLFGQANEMVAQERKARARLEERVKVLEDRDGEKRRRLERLEKALQRIERVRGLVAENTNTMAMSNLHEKSPVTIEVNTIDDERGVAGDRLRVVNGAVSVSN